MPRKDILIPEDRSEWSFGNLLAYHLFIRGTRPEIAPFAKTGRVWSAKEAMDAFNVTPRAFWYWIDDKHLPYTTAAAERILFGDNPAYDDDRLEFRERLAASRARKTAKPASAAPETPFHAPEPYRPGRGLTVHTVYYGELEDPEPAPNETPGAENFGKDQAKPRRDGLIGVLPKGWDRSKEAPPSANENVPASKRKPVAVAFAIFAVLVGIVYAFTRPGRDPQVTKASPTIATTSVAPNPPPPPVVPTKDADAERRAAADRAAAEERRKAMEAEARAKAEKQVGVSTIRDAVDRQRLEDEAKARAINDKLKALAQSDGDDLCKKKLEGINAPGFNLRCDTLIPFGELLGAVPVSQTASSLGDCAARCRRVAKCKAFSFDAGAHHGSASCYLTGSIPAYNKAENWISGTR